MKKLDQYILKQFSGPFLITFFIVLFILDMQLLFRYIKDFAGKGLDTASMLEFLGYASLSLIPMAMPLAILLSAIMTFGNLGERYELAALKASGISLLWVFRSLTALILLISIGMHFYMEDALPKINFHLLNMEANMVRKNAAVQLRPGIFDNAIPGYYIRVGNKSGPKNNLLHDVFIKRVGSFYTDQETIVSKRGKMLNSPSPNYLIMELNDGSAYRDEVKGKNRTQLKRQPMNVVHFHKLIQYIDISFITRTDLNKTISDNHRKMLNSKKLRKFSDSFAIVKSREIASYTKKALRRAIPIAPPPKFKCLIKRSETPTYSFSSLLIGKPKIDQLLVSRALKSARENLNTQIEQYDRLKWHTREIGSLHIELQRKWSLSIACLILFFIGAPLGSIIRKGGFGMPFLAAVIVFVIYYILSIIGENMTTRGRWNPFLGSWFNAITLFPLGLYLTYRATVDAALFNADCYLNPLKKLFERFKKQTKHHA